MFLGNNRLRPIVQCCSLIRANQWRGILILVVSLEPVSGGVLSSAKTLASFQWGVLVKGVLRTKFVAVFMLGRTIPQSNNTNW